MRPRFSVNPPSAGPADLVRAARGGDIAALGALYDRYAPALFRTVQRFVDSGADAEDVVHDLFVGLPEALRAYDERGKLDAWLARIAVRYALMRLRAQRRRREDPIERAADVPFDDNAALAVERAAGHATERATLFAAVRQLPEPLRQVLLLRQVEDFSHHEIAELLGISVGNSRVRLARALDALRRTLRPSPR